MIDTTDFVSLQCLSSVDTVTLDHSQSFYAHMMHIQKDLVIISLNCNIGIECSAEGSS